MIRPSFKLEVAVVESQESRSGFLKWLHLSVGEPYGRRQLSADERNACLRESVIRAPPSPGVSFVSRGNGSIPGSDLRAVNGSPKDIVPQFSAVCAYRLG